MGALAARRASAGREGRCSAMKRRQGGGSGLDAMEGWERLGHLGQRPALIDQRENLGLVRPIPNPSNAIKQAKPCYFLRFPATAPIVATS